MGTKLAMDPLGIDPTPAKLAWDDLIDALANTQV
jgi:hypothetical protein